MGVRSCMATLYPQATLADDDWGYAFILTRPRRADVVSLRLEPRCRKVS